MSGFGGHAIHSKGKHDRVKTLMSRLAAACNRQGWAGDTWSKGVEAIQRKCSVVIWLSKFEPVGMKPLDCDSDGNSVVTIQHDWVSEE